MLTIIPLNGLPCVSTHPVYHKYFPFFSDDRNFLLLSDINSKLYFTCFSSSDKWTFIFVSTPCTLAGEVSVTGSQGLQRGLVH